MFFQYFCLCGQKKIKFEAKTMRIANTIYDSFVIQIRKLVNPIRSELERVLQVFNQTYISSDDEKILEIKETELGDNELLRLMAERLRNAAADEEILNQVEILEEVEGMIEEHIREKQELAEKNAGLTDTNAQLLKEIEELKKRLGEKKG